MKNNFIQGDNFDLASILTTNWVSKSGVIFTPSSDIWSLEEPRKLRSNTTGVNVGVLDFNSLTNKPLELRYVLATLAKTRSFGTIKTYVYDLKSLRSTLTNGEIVDYAWFAAQKTILGKAKEYKLSSIRKLIGEWLNSDVDIPNPDDALQISKERLKQAPFFLGVKGRDEKSGPLSRVESTNFFKALNSCLESKDISLFQFITARLFYEIGFRPIQFHHLRLSDFILNERRAYVLIPRAKQGAEPRELFTKRQISDGLRMAIKAFIDTINTKIPNADLSKIGIINPETSHFSSREQGELYISTSRVRGVLNEVNEILGVQSERTGKPLNVKPIRLRHTLATEAIENGEDIFTVAKMLDHETLTSVKHYVDIRNSTIESLESKIGSSIANLASAFRGKVVKKGAISVGGEVIEPENFERVGGCGTEMGCGLPHPIACYSCIKFEAYSEAPHDLVLEQVIKSIEKHRSSYPGYVKQLEQDAISIKRVMLACEEFRKDNE